MSLESLSQVRLSSVFQNSRFHLPAYHSTNKLPYILFCHRRRSLPSVAYTIVSFLPSPRMGRNFFTCRLRFMGLTVENTHRLLPYMSWASFTSFSFRSIGTIKKNPHNASKSRLWGSLLRIGLLLSKGDISRSGNRVLYIAI